MLQNFRLQLIGKKVLRAERDSGGVGLQLSEGWSIAIWKACTLSCPSKNTTAKDELNRIVGASLVTFVGDNQAEKLTFSNGCVIDVDLYAEPGSIAESMAVYGPNKLIVIWE
jgi:hypothetical protein